MNFSNVTVTDTTLNQQIPNPTESFQGQITTGTYNYTTSQTDFDYGTVVNIETSSCIFNYTSLSKTTTATINAVQHPALATRI